MDLVMRGYHKTFEVPVQQADAVLNQAAPTSGTKYEVLATTKNVRIISIEVNCTWTAQPSPLEVHITIDGQTITYGIANPISATNYLANPNAEKAEDSQILNTSSYHDRRSFLIEGRSVKVEAEITGGTVSNLSARIKYAKW